ncbi:DUF1152 domain-containing protein [Geoglobus acetivorans]|uniref:DUF1152 domain-containing protein n=1 Tax=Geoglobus acetivorans TaxID=565033 RepID=A0ABZ3H4A4_GEOAI
MKIIDIAMKAEKALLIGIGGGGDVISTIYVKNFLEKFGVECICGGVVWERYRRDRKVGPRSLDEIEGVKRISRTLGYVSGSERLGSITPIVSQVADFLKERVLAVSITEGVVTLRNDLQEFINASGIDIVFGVDAGGDSLARGNERGLTSPLADSVMLSALSDLNSILAVVGFGSDGELSKRELEAYLSDLHSAVYGVSIVDVSNEIIEFLKNVESEASKIPAIARNGYFGKYNFWGELELEISILNSLIFYLNLKEVYMRSPMARAIYSTESIVEANEILNRMGIKTEYDLEKEMEEMDRVTAAKNPSE